MSFHAKPSLRDSHFRYDSHNYVVLIHTPSNRYLSSVIETNAAAGFTRIGRQKREADSQRVIFFVRLQSAFFFSFFFLKTTDLTFHPLSDDTVKRALEKYLLIERAVRLSAFT